MTKAKPKTIEIPYATLNTYLSVLASCSPEARVHVTRNKIATREVDTANVFMVNVEAECKTSGQFVFGIDVSALRKVIKYAKGCNVIIEIVGEKIKVKYGRFDARIEALLDITLRKDPNPPTINLPLTFEVPGKYLNDALKMVGRDSRGVFVSKSRVVFFCVEEGTTHVREIISETKNKESFKSMFSNDYMKDIINVVKDVSLKIDIGNDHPMRAYAEKNDCKIEYLLAPRIESD